MSNNKNANPLELIYSEERAEVRFYSVNEARLLTREETATQQS
jgi:hypothetical protein